MNQITQIVSALNAAGEEGLLLTDFRRRDPFAYQILGLPLPSHISRRWFVAIHRDGRVCKICHRIEPSVLDAIDGECIFYSSREELESAVQKVLRGWGSVAMCYSPAGGLPIISTVDAGTIELVRSCGVQVVSASEVLQRSSAVLDRLALESHLEAGRKVDRIRGEAFAFLRDGAGRVTEHDAVQFILKRFAEENLETSHAPCVAANAHAALPHYEPAAEGSSLIKQGDFVLIDLWAKLSKPGAIFYDITWCGVLRASPTPEESNVFALVRKARDGAVNLIREKRARGETVCGMDADIHARSIIREGGFGERFIHRLGHSIGENIHGEGANLDSFETCDTRQLIPWSCFSVEPGVYLENFGIRLELNMFLTDTESLVTGEVQTELLTLV